MTDLQEETILAEEATKEIRKTKTLGKVMKAFRETQGISQCQLADRIGVSKQFLSDIENDRKNIGVPFIRKFAEELGFSPESFIRIYVQDFLKKAGLSEYEIHLTKKAG